jgi:putative ABC transport system permease protein
MMIATRWRKLFGDFNAIQGRILMMVATIAIGIYGVAALSSGYVILSREIARNYIATNAASAHIDVDATADARLVASILQNPDILAADATATVVARVELKPDEWVRLVLFVIPDFVGLRINRIFPQRGAYPPGEGTLLLERESLTFLRANIGDAIRLQTPNGLPTSVTVSGTVHDPGLAPAWQQQTVYGYLTPATLASLGEDARLTTLRIVVRDALHNQAKVDAVATDVASGLRKQGLKVHEVLIPPTGQHPHQTQMTTVLFMFITFAFVALLLGAVLTASMIDGLLAQQVRQIAVMKAIGARSAQIAGLYLTAVLSVATCAVLIGVPAGIFSGHRFADVIAELLNFDVATYDIPGWLAAALAIGGLVIPLTFALVPIRRATFPTIHEAISDYSIKRTEFGGRWFDSVLASVRGVDRTLILAIRNAFRRRGRLLLTVGLLAVAGSVMLASLSVQKAWIYFIVASAHDRNYDLELQFDRPAPVGPLLSAVQEVNGVEKVEPWNTSPAAVARPDGLAVVREYPDRWHGALPIRSMPRADSLSHLVFLEGRPPRDGESGAILLNQGAQNALGNPHAGDAISLSVEGRIARLRVVGVVRQIVTPAAMYTTEAAYEAVAGIKETTNAIRIAAARHEPDYVSALARAIERRLQRDGVRIISSASETKVDGEVSGHVKILISSLIIISVLMAATGLLGLASAQGINVAERIREFGIMRAIGGTSAVVIRNVIAEGAFTGLVSIVMAVVLALPLAASLGWLVGTLSFALPLPLKFSLPALGIWICIVGAGAVAASLVPALGAARLTIRETLAHI